MTPRPLLIGLFALAGLLFVAAIWMPTWAVLGILVNLGIGLTAIIDLLISPRTRRVRVEREFAPVFSVGKFNRVTLRAVQRSAVAIRVEFSDEPPQPGQVEGLPAELLLEPGRAAELTYDFEPFRRGRFTFGAVYLRFETRLGLWMRDERRELPMEVRVYPDIRTVHEFDLLAVRDRMADTGLKQYRVRGQGGEFERLREYRREDELRHVDWKASAKYRRLISREFNVERNQNVVVLLDCGRSMCNETDGISHLDSGLNTATILSYIALGQGDNVSLMAFSNRIERYIGPMRGKPAVQSIVRQMYDLEPRWEASDYGMACDELLRRQRKRALVVLITHSIDDQHLWTVEAYTRSLTRPHVFVCVLIRDRALSELAGKVPETDVGAFQAAGASELITRQRRKLQELQQNGAIVVEAFPDELSAAVINRYLELKARQRL